MVHRVSPALLDRRISVAVAKMERNLAILRAPELVGWILPKEGMIRRTLFAIVLSPVMDWILVTLVICNAIAMGFFDPTSPPSSRRNTSVTAVSLAINSVFAIELGLKLVAFGAIGRGSYFISGSGSIKAWNCLDFALVGIGFAGVSPMVGQISALRLLRLLRWAYTKVPGMRIVLLACFNALPGLGAVLSLAAMTYLVFGLIGLCSK